ncbi:hypothetical protein EDD22DRAFT_850314 [Suillus occidentalis]|nr:hypothetical protein EDD22DRAFT_850314 [Suillus occidentalis]
MAPRFSWTNQGIKSLSPQARAQAVVAIGANTEWRRARAVAAALQIDAIVEHKKFMHMTFESEAESYANAVSEPLETSIQALAGCTPNELDDREKCSIAAYVHEASSFASSDKDLDDAENLTSNGVATSAVSNTSQSIVFGYWNKYAHQVCTLANAAICGYMYFCEPTHFNMNQTGGWPRGHHHRLGVATASQVNFKLDKVQTPESSWLQPRNLGYNSDDSFNGHLRPPQPPQPPWNLPTSGSAGRSDSESSVQSQSFFGDNSQPTSEPRFRLSSENLSAHNATATYSDQRSDYLSTHVQDRDCAGSSRPNFDPQIPVKETELSQPGSATAHAATYRHNNSHLQEPEGGWQHQVSAPGIQAPDAAESYNFWLSQSQEHAACNQHQTFASGIPVSDTAAASYSSQLSHLQEHAGGSQPASAPPAPNSASYDVFIPHSQDYVGGSHQSSQPGLQSSTGGTTFHHHSSSNASQNAPQATTLPQQFSLSTSVEPFQIQATRMQSSSSSSGVHYPDEQGQRLPHPGFVDRLGCIRPINEKIALRSSLPYVVPPPRQSSRPVLPSSLIDIVKIDAATHMKTSLFHHTLFPSTQTTEELAKSALNKATAVHITNAAEFKKWKSRKEGHTVLAQLKSSVKKLHKNSRDYAQGLVAGGYDLSMDVFNHTTDVATSRQNFAGVLSSNYDFLDTFIQRIAENGELSWFRVPFGNSTVRCMVEYMLVDQQFRHQVDFNSVNWESRLMNVIALAGTICHWGHSVFGVVTPWLLKQLGRIQLFRQYNVSYGDERDR